MILENLIELRQKFQAGKSTLSNEEINELITKSIDFINDFQNDLFINFENVSELSQLFTSIDEGDFVKVFVSKFDEKSFYKLGEKLFEILKTNNEPTKSIIENILYTFLNFIRNSEFLRKIFDDKNWTNLISKIIEETNFNTRKMFQQRSNQYRKKNLFKVIKGEKVQDYTWNETNKIIGSYSQSLSILLNEHIEKPRVAFLLENSFTMALLDLLVSIAELLML